MNTRKRKNEQGFTLIEMMIVMLIISVLLIITIPNVAKHNSNINNKGCEAYVKMVQAQVQAYEMDKNKVPTLEDLKSDGYLKEDAKGCPNGETVEIADDGTVTAVAKTTTP
jgi:competence protein ComGC